MTTEEKKITVLKVTELYDARKMCYSYNAPEKEKYN